MANLKSLTLVLFGILLISSVTAFRKQYIQYYDNNYANQAAAVNEAASTTAYTSDVEEPSIIGLFGPIGGGYDDVSYLNTNSAYQAAEQSSSGSTVDYVEELPTIIGFKNNNKRQYIQYYDNNYANQAAAVNEAASTTAYNSAIQYPTYALGGFYGPAGLVGGGYDNVNYLNTNSAYQAAEQSSSGSTVDYVEELPTIIGFKNNNKRQFVEYYDNNYANQAAAVNEAASTTAYTSDVEEPSIIGLFGPIGGGYDDVSYLNTNSAYQAAEQSSSGSTVDYVEELPTIIGFKNNNKRRRQH